MPKNKNASYRYRLIDKALTNRSRRWKFTELLEYISDKMYEEYDKEGNVSERTLVDDFRIMRKEYPEGYGAPIKRRGGFVYYGDPDFSINNSPLREEDVNSIDEALATLSQFTALPLFKELIPVVRKVRGIVAASERSNYDSNIVQFEQNSQLKGLEFMEPIYKAISKEQTLSIVYHSYRKPKAEELTVSPYLLKENNNRWFLIGWAEESDKEIKILGLDRIIKLEDSPFPFQNTKRDWIKKFDRIVGVSFPNYDLDAPMEKIKLWISKGQKNYILTKPIHDSQTLLAEHDDGSIIIELTVVPNYELITRILEGRDKIKVLEPATLMEEVKKIYTRSLKLYD